MTDESQERSAQQSVAIMAIVVVLALFTAVFSLAPDKPAPQPCSSTHYQLGDKPVCLADKP